MSEQLLKCSSTAVFAVFTMHVWGKQGSLWSPINSSEILHGWVVWPLDRNLLQYQDLQLYVKHLSNVWSCTKHCILQDTDMFSLYVLHKGFYPISPSWDIKMRCLISATKEMVQTVYKYMKKAVGN